MEVFLIYPKSEQAQKELAHELAKFHAEQALKNILKLPCSTEQKLELVDAVVKHLKEQAYECFLLGKHTVERACSGLSPLRRDRLWC